jgi:LysR family transcriptional regulator, regulator for bpeEF and oprC
MEISSLQAFVKVVQCGSFTRAADVLGTQKAHLSRVLTQLEKEMGARSLTRSTRALSLTEVGREFYERSVAILAQVDEAQKVVQQAQGQPSGTLRISCGVEFGMLAVSTWIGEYMQRYPDVRVEADYSARKVDLVHEGVDLAIRIGPLTDSSLNARKLGEITYGLFAAPQFLQTRSWPTYPSELANEQLLAFSSGLAADAWTLQKEGETVRLPLKKPRLLVNNVFALRDLALTGLGIARLPWLVARREAEQGRLQVLLTDWHIPSTPVHAVFASARYLTPKVRSFIDLAVTHMGQGAN